MTQTANIPANPAPNSEISGWSFHHHILYLIVAGRPGARTGDIHTIYEALASILYEGRAITPLENRQYRRKHLTHLREAGVLCEQGLGAGSIWFPFEKDGDVSTPSGLEPELEKTAELGEHKRALLNLLQSCDGAVPMSDIYPRYSKESVHPRSERTIRKYLSEMARADLIEAVGEKRGRRYRASSEEV